MKLSIFPLAGIISLFWVTAATAAPELALDHPTFDFGSINQGKKVQHVFTFSNKGDVPLTIKSIKPSCGCTAVSSSASVIPPGKKGHIKATFDSANFGGSIKKTISVDTNDPHAPSQTLTLTGKVIEMIEITPKQLSLGQIRVNDTRKTVITIGNNGSKPLKITALKTPIPQIVATIDKNLLNPQESASITLSITPRSGDRILSSYLVIKTDSPVKSDIMVPIFGSVIN